MPRRARPAARDPRAHAVGRSYRAAGEDHVKAPRRSARPAGSRTGAGVLFGYGHPPPDARPVRHPLDHPAGPAGGAGDCPRAPPRRDARRHVVGIEPLGDHDPRGDLHRGQGLAAGPTQRVERAARQAAVAAPATLPCVARSGAAEWPWWPADPARLTDRAPRCPPIAGSAPARPGGPRGRIRRAHSVQQELTFAPGVSKARRSAAPERQGSVTRHGIGHSPLGTRPRSLWPPGGRGERQRRAAP